MSALNAMWSMVLRPRHASAGGDQSDVRRNSLLQQIGKVRGFGWWPSGADALVEITHHHEPLRRCARENPGKMFQVDFVVLPFPAHAAELRGPRPLPGDAQADNGNLSHRSPCDARDVSSRRHPFITDVVYVLPWLPRPQQNFPAIFSNPTAVVWAWAYPVFVLEQFAVRLRETDDLGRVPIDSVADLDAML